MLCTDRQRWKTRGISYISPEQASLHLHLDAGSQIHSHFTVDVKCCLLAGATGEEPQGMPPNAQGWSFRELAPKSRVRHHHLAAPAAPARGHSPPWMPLPPPDTSGPSLSRLHGGPCLRVTFPSWAKEVQTISPLVMVPVWTHLARTSPQSQALAELGTCVHWQQLDYGGSEPQEPFLTVKADLNAKLKYMRWTRDLSQELGFC